MSARTDENRAKSGLPALVAAAWEAWTGLPPRRVEISGCKAAPAQGAVRTRLLAKIDVHWRPTPIERELVVDRYPDHDAAGAGAGELLGGVGENPSVRPSVYRPDSTTVVWMDPVEPDVLHAHLRRIDPIASLAAS